MRVSRRYSAKNLEHKSSILVMSEERGADDEEEDEEDVSVAVPVVVVLAVVGESEEGPVPILYCKQKSNSSCCGLGKPEVKSYFTEGL